MACDLPARLCARPWARRKIKENYPDKTLRLRAQRIRRWRDQGKLVFVYFDNDQKSAAPADAHRLAMLLARS